MRKLRTFILWSGGKDSYLSYKKASRRGFSIRYALSYVERRTRRLIGCHLREELVKEQAEKLGMEFLPVYGSKRRGDFLRSLKELLTGLSVEAGVFGDVYRREHRNQLEGVCGSLGIRAVFPLWGMAEEVILSEVLQISRPTVVCRRVRKLPRRFLGRELDEEILNFLREQNLSLSGENGEYQTFVGSCEDFELNVSVLKTFRKSYYECIDLVLGGGS